MGLKNMFFVILLVLCLCSFLASAQLDSIETELELVMRDKKRLDSFIENTWEYLEADRRDSVIDAVQLIESFLDDAKDYLKVRDYFEAELQIELAKMSLAKSYQLASRSEIVEGRVISVDSPTLTRYTLNGTLPELVEKVADAGFNAIFVEVIRDEGYVVYPSEYMVQWPELVGTDPLEELVFLGKKYDIDIFPWQKVFFATANGTQGPILTEHPEWAALDKNLRNLDAYGNAWFSPGHPEARELIFNYILEMWTRYDFAGCQIDFVRNAINPGENSDFSYDKATLDLFMTYYGFNPLKIEYPAASTRTRETYIPGSSGAKWELWQSFRENLITSFIAKLTLAMKEVKPDALISSGIATALWGGGTLQQALYRQQNWPDWVELGLTQILSSLIYQNDVSIVEREVGNVRDLAKGKAMQYPSLGVQVMDRPFQLLEQIEAVRDLGEPGMRIFAYPHMKDEHFKLLKDGPFREKAYPPHRDLYLAGFILLKDLVEKIEPDKEYYEDILALKNRLERSSEGNENTKVSAARFVATRLKRLDTGEYVVDAALRRLETIMNVYMQFKR